MHPSFDAAEYTHAGPGDLAYCRALLRDGSRSFLAAAHLLPWRVRDPAVSLYAFCRVADDAIDLGADPAAALAELRERVDAAYAGRPWDTPADRALADVMAQFAIPPALPLALLEGFAWDVERRRYEDLGALTDYAVRVAGAVGAMMTLLMGVRDPDTVARACDLGVAMQLTNIARDVGEDARSGRLYLPQAWLRKAGVDPQAWLAEPAFSPAIGDCVARLLAAAAVFYGRAQEGIARLPAACRPGISAAAVLYGAIGREVARRGHDSVSGRAVVPPWRKAALFAQALAGSTPRTTPAPVPATQAQFLIDAVDRTRPVERRPLARLDDRIAWLVSLIDRLDRHQQAH